MNRPTSYEQIKKDWIRGCGCLVAFILIVACWLGIGLIILAIWSAQ